MNLLSADEVCRVTGYQRPSAQVRYCRLKGIAHLVSGSGEVIITVTALNQTKDAETTEPDFRYLHAAQ